MALTTSERGGAAVIYVRDGEGERACITCKQYRRYYWREPVPGEVYHRSYAANTGFCKLLCRQRGALCKPCKDYETEPSEK